LKGRSKIADDRKTHTGGGIIVSEKRSVYLKLFLATGIPFGTLAGLFYTVLYGLPFGSVAGLLAGVFFGGLMSLILGSLHIRSVGRVQSERAGGALGVHHVRSIELALPYDEAFDLCIESLRSIRKCRIQEEDRLRGKIVARTGITWKTWGDVITFELRRIEGNRTLVTVSSRPVVRTTLVDYGKNLENVERICSFLKERRNGV
jgi:hypothetical protein